MNICWSKGKWGAEPVHLSYSNIITFYWSLGGGATNDSSEDDIAKNVLASSGSDGETAEAAPKATKKKRVIA